MAQSKFDNISKRCKMLLSILSSRFRHSALLNYNGKPVSHALASRESVRQIPLGRSIPPSIL